MHGDNLTEYVGYTSVVITNITKGDYTVTTPALTRDIGRAKRNMRALLGRLLDQAGISFPEWTIRPVTTITDELLGDLPQADLEATRRTLAEVTRRASARIIFGG
jgi:hypothetical protein